MSQAINVNGQSINYPETGDTNWGDEATNFAVQTSAALGKLGLASGTSVDIAQTLDVTGNTTLDANLSVGGNATITGNSTIGNLTVFGSTTLGDAPTSGDSLTVNGILNVDSGVLYVNPTSNQVGINKTNPSQALDVVGNVAITGNETVGGTLNVTGATSLSTSLAVTGNSTIGNLTVFGSTTLGDASGDSLTINSNGVSIPNGLNFDSNTLVIDAANNKIGIGTTTPNNYSDSNTISQTILRADQSLTFGAYFEFGVGQYAFINSAAANKNTAIPLKLRTGDVDRLQIAANGQLSAVVAGGSTLYPGYLCRAWVNFDGTGSTGANQTIRGSGNVSSVFKNGTGNYTINIDIDMPDANYSALVSTKRDNNDNTANFGDIAMIYDLLAGSFRFLACVAVNGNKQDPIYCNAAVFR